MRNDYFIQPEVSATVHGPAHPTPALASDARGSISQGSLNDLDGR